MNSISPSRQIKINESDYLDTMLALLDRDMKNITAQLRQPHVTQWATTPSNVNAFHTFQSNAISESIYPQIKEVAFKTKSLSAIPLAILQFPFYNLGLE